MSKMVKVFTECQDVKKSKFINLIAFRLKEIDPDAFDECVQLCTPRIKDIELIPIVIDEIIAVFPFNAENQPAIFATLYLLFAPWKIIQHDNKLPVGMRDFIAKSLNLPYPEMVSQYSQNIYVYWKGRHFKAKVMELADKIYNELSEGGFID